jgi:hypothetical protein
LLIRSEEQNKQFLQIALLFQDYYVGYHHYGGGQQDYDNMHTGEVFIISF